MKIGGLIPFSLSDFPGRATAVVFTQGCNFCCPYCHNGSLIPQEASSERRISDEEIIRFLETRRGRLDGVVVSGGEPTLQPDLSKFIHRIKAMSFKVKLDTNGSRPNVLRNLLQEKRIDFISMDIKAPLTIYDRLCGVRVRTELLEESISIIATGDIAHEFRTTVVKSLLTVNDVRSVQEIVPRDSPHRIQVFRRENALEPWLRKANNRPMMRNDILHQQDEETKPH